MTTQAIDATIFASSHPDIAKRTSVSGLIFSCIMLLAGVIAFVSTFEMEDRSSTISMGLMVLGTALFLIGVFRLFWKSKEIVYLPTGSVAKEQSIFFDLKDSMKAGLSTSDKLYLTIPVGLAESSKAKKLLVSSLSIC